VLESLSSKQTQVLIVVVSLFVALPTQCNCLFLFQCQTHNGVTQLDLPRDWPRRQQHQRDPGGDRRPHRHRQAKEGRTGPHRDDQVSAKNVLIPLFFFVSVQSQVFLLFSCAKISKTTVRRSLRTTHCVDYCFCCETPRYLLWTSVVLLDSVIIKSMSGVCRCMVSCIPMTRLLPPRRGAAEAIKHAYNLITALIKEDRSDQEISAIISKVQAAQSAMHKQQQQQQKPTMTVVAAPIPTKPAWTVPPSIVAQASSQVGIEPIYCKCTNVCIFRQSTQTPSPVNTFVCPR